MTDRVLDKQVAEKVFDRHIVSNTSMCRCVREHIIEARPYSTDPAAMLQVVEKMRELGREVNIRANTQNNTHNWNVWFPKPDEYRMEPVSDVSLGRAVCLAALSALTSEAPPQDG